MSKKWTKLGDELKQYRESSGYTLTALLERLNQEVEHPYESHATIAHWESGSRKPKRFLLLSLAMIFLEKGAIQKEKQQAINAFNALLTLAEELPLDHPPYKNEFERYIEPYLTRSPHRVTYNQFLYELQLRRVYTPLSTLSLTAEMRESAETFAFAGLKWSQFFGFASACIQADALEKTQLAQCVATFNQLGDDLYNKRKVLGQPRLAWLLSTMAGVLCFVFEDGIDVHEVDEIVALQREAPFYDRPIFGMDGFNTKMSCFVWVVDLQAQRVYQHLGRQSVTANLHIRFTRQAMQNLHTLLLEIMRG